MDWLFLFSIFTTIPKILILKSLPLLFVYLISALGLSQSETEILLYNINTENNILDLADGKNVSENEGYDNQPYFLDNETIMFSSTRNGQTDIARYHSKYGSKSWLNFSEGSEYSPIKVPSEYAVTAIKLDPDGTQQLWKYDLSNGESHLYKSDLKIGYQLWHDENTLITSVLSEGKLDLYATNTNTNVNTKLDQNIGRSIHNVPNSSSISYVSKENEDWQIKTMKLSSGKSKNIIQTLKGSEDFCWLNDGTLLMGKENKLYRFHPKKDKEWILFKEFDSISAITRLAVSPDNTKLALVAEPNILSNSSNQSNNEISNLDSTEAIELVQSHIAPYNAGDLDGFLEPFATDVKVYQFPNKLISSNKEEMMRSYSNFFQRNDKLQVFVNNRLNVKSYVIDEEISTVNNSTNRQVTIYKTGTDGIESMNFISETASDESPESIVNKQLEAYNRRDIDAFLDTYSSNIELFMYPRESSSKGKDAMRQQYGSMFENVADLNAEIVGRMVIGNKIIDKEKVTYQGQTIYAIAIYEVENSLISKVTFIQ